ncbi:hypothetical protein [uncultured Roseobacter sp.]|uniref:hypothetical protein n=1 Tax=uncultured Roseobacter sp. TaxID=114847 RepID=UPI002615EEDC|nr:hypothetical protein [uncultured Roseobacter sp.]
MMRKTTAPDKTDLGFSTFAGAASLCKYGGLLAALQPMSRKRSLRAGLERLAQTTLSLHGVWTRKTPIFQTFAAAAFVDVKTAGF